LDTDPADVPGAPAADRTNWTGLRRIYVMAVLCVIAVVYFIDRQIISILIQPIKAEFHVSDKAMGLLTGIMFAGAYAVAGIPVARLIDTYPRKYVLAGCLTIWSVLTSLGGVAQNFTQLALSRIGVAAAEAGSPPSGYSIASDLFSAKARGTAIATIAAAQSFGIGMGVLLGGVLSQAFSWRVSFLIVGLPGVLLAILLLTTVKEPPRALSDAPTASTAKTTLGETLRRLWSIRSFRCFAVITGMAGFTGYGLLIWGPTFVLRVFHLSPAKAGIWFGITTSAALVSGNLFGGFLADRLGGRDLRAYMWIAAGGPLLCIPAGIWFATSSTWQQAMMAFFLLQFSLTSHIPTSYAMGQTLAPARMRATASTILSLSSTIIGAGLAPFVIGASNDFLNARFGEEAIRYSAAIVLIGALFASVAALTATIWIRGDYARMQRWSAGEE